MRFIKYIVIHCTAGYGDVAAITRFWRKELGWKSPGYHYFIYQDGRVEQLAPISAITNGVKGFNEHAVNVAYQGGVDRNDYSKAVDTRTPAQKESLLKVIDTIYRELSKHQKVDAIKINGHRDFSPDKNGSGVIEPYERIKECPSFDAIPEYMKCRGSAARLSKALVCLLLSLTLFACGTRRKAVVSEDRSLETKNLTEISQGSQSMTTDYFGDFINGRFSFDDLLSGDTLAFETGGVSVKFTADTNSKGRQTIGFDVNAKPTKRTAWHSYSNYYWHLDSLHQAENKKATEKETTNPLTGWLWVIGLLVAVIIILVIVIKFK